MPILYKKAKQAVDKQYDQLIATGYTPVLNADKESYAWVNKSTGAKYRGTDPIGGIEAGAGVGDVFKRNRRQRRLMSEKAGAAAQEANEAEQINQTESTTSGDTDNETTKSKDATTGATTAQRDKTVTSIKLPSAGIAGLNMFSLVPQQMKAQLAERTVMPSKKEDSDISLYTGQKNVSSPYMYVSDDDFDKVKGNLSIGDRFGRPLPVPLLGLHRGGAELEHAGMTGSGLGMTEKSGTKIPYEIRRNGKHYRLLPNPDFIDRTYELSDLDKIKKFYGNNAQIETVEIDGKKCLKVNKDFSKKFFDTSLTVLKAGIAEKTLSILPGTKKLFNRKPKAKKPTVSQSGEGWDDLLEHGSDVYKNGGKLRFNFID